MRALQTALLVSIFFGFATKSVGAVTYYVDSGAGNDGNSCAQAQNTSSPRRTVAGIMGCNPGAGDTVRFRGNFSETIRPVQSGQVLQATTAVNAVRGSNVEFSSGIPTVNAQTDYVTIYNSRKGNSGAFRVVGANGNTVTVDISNHPGGAFLEEVAADPGNLQAAIIRPVHFTAWDAANEPTWNFSTAMYYGFNNSAVMLSHLRSLSGTNNEVWGAIYLDGGGGGGNDYFVVDRVTIENAATAIGLSNNDFHANYAVIQHSTFRNIGWNGGVSDEIIYWGNFLQYQKHHDYPQIMYNRVGPHKPMTTNPNYGTQAMGDGIEVKASGHFPTIFGNIITGMSLTNGCDDSPIHSAGEGGFIANNYIDDVNPSPNNVPGCGISIVEGARGANGTIVANNILRNVKSVGIRVFNTSNVQVVNNTIYDVHPISGCCAEESAGIMIQTDGEPATGNVIRNNVVHNVPVGIGRYPWSTSEQFSVTTSNNIVYNATTPWGVGITPASTDRVVNPALINPAGGNFALGTGSAAIGAAANLSSLFVIDNPMASNPTGALRAPTVRAAAWDAGAASYGTATGTPTPTPSATPTPAPTNPACSAADIDQDGSVTATDRTLLMSAILRTPITNARADQNGDGSVDVTDYSLLARFFGQRCQ